MTTKVIFKIERNKGAEVVAFFPAWAGDSNPYRTCTCYAHMGQHSAASLEYARSLRPATPEEYAPLLREMVQVGYDDLRIVRRFTRWDLEERKKQTAR